MEKKNIIYVTRTIFIHYLIIASMRAKSVPLNLYRRILRLHRAKLPPDMRPLGDSYVTDEFRRHKDAKEEFVSKFLIEWKHYADQLEHQPDLGKHGFDALRSEEAIAKEEAAMDALEIGRHLSEEELEALSGEQKLQLQNLRKATREAFGGGDVVQKEEELKSEHDDTLNISESRPSSRRPNGS